MHHEPTDYMPTEGYSHDSTTVNIDVAKIQGQMMPVMATWRFRVMEDGRQVFSFMQIQYFKFEFEQEEAPFQELCTEIQHSHNLFVRTLYKEAFRYEIDANSINPFPLGNVSNLALKLESIARRHSLL